VTDFDLDVHAKVFKVANRANGETNDVEIVNLFNFTLTDNVSDWCNNYMGDSHIVLLQNYNSLFVKDTKKFKMMSKFTYS